MWVWISRLGRYFFCGLILHHKNDTMMIKNVISLDLKKATFIELSVNHAGKKKYIKKKKLSKRRKSTDTIHVKNANIGQYISQSLVYSS